MNRFTRFLDRANFWLAARRRSKREQGYRFAAGLLLGSRGSIDPRDFIDPLTDVDYAEGVIDAERDWRSVAGVRAKLQTLHTMSKIFPDLPIDAAFATYAPHAERVLKEFDA